MNELIEKYFGERTQEILLVHSFVEMLYFMYLSILFGSQGQPNKMLHLLHHIILYYTILHHIIP